MARSIAAQTLQEINASQTQRAFFFLLEITHPTFTDPIRVTDTNLQSISGGERGMVSNGVEYVYLPFEVSLPTDDEDQRQQLTLRIDNVSREIVRAVRTAGQSEAITIALSLAVDNDPDNPIFTLNNYKLRNAKYDIYAVEGTLSIDHLDGEPFPGPRFGPANFPGMHA